MIRCLICDQSYSRRDELRRHERNVHGSGKNIDQSQPLKEITFQHPFSMMVTGPSGSGKTEWTRQLLLTSLIHPPPERILWCSMMVTGPSGSGKTEWTRKLLLTSLIHPPPERILWCFGQWQSLYEDLQKRIPWIEFVHGILDYLNSPQFINPGKWNLIIFDDLMTEGKCDQRIADLFTKGSHHRNISIVYLTQNVFPQGKACRDIALNTQYLVLFNNPIDRQQAATLARRIYPSTSAMFMKRFEGATSQPYGYLVIDLKSSTSEQDRLQTDIFESTDQHAFEPPDEETLSDDEDASSVESLDYINDLGPPGKRRKLRDASSRPDIWNRRFQNPLRQANTEQFKAKVNAYEEQGFTLEKAIHFASNGELPYLRKRLRLEYAQFLIDFYELQEDPIQQQILESARTIRNQHDMNQTDSIRQAIKLRKDLFMDIWPNRNIEENHEQDGASEEE